MHAVTLELPPPINYIFVDFENVHAIEPGSAGSNGVSFMLLLGPRQKLEATLLERLLESCTLLQLVRVTASGRNALDFTLAYYVGRAVAADPSGVFHIISKDKGYDPLVEHLRGKRIEAYRHNDFASVTFWGSPKSSAPISPPAAETVKPSPNRKPQPLVLSDQATQVLLRLRRVSATRPRNQKKLVSYSIAQLGHKITQEEATGIVQDLRQSGYLAIDQKGAVTYQLDDR